MQTPSKHTSLKLRALSSNILFSIVFIHGLLGNAYGTWTKNNVLWPQDLLPKDVPSCRVLLYGYDSRVLRTGRGQLPTSYTELRSDADDFCARLAADRASKSRVCTMLMMCASDLFDPT